MAKNKVAVSKFIFDAEPALRKLVSKLLERYEYASVLAQDSYTKSYGASRNGLSAGESGMLCARGFTVRVHDKRGYCEYSCDAVSEQDIDRIADEIDTQLIPMADGLERNDYPVAPDEPEDIEKASEYETDPFELGDETMLAKVCEIREKTLACSDKLLDVSTRAQIHRSTKLFVSKNKRLCQSLMWTTCMCAALAPKGEEIKMNFRSYSGLEGAEVLDRALADVENIASVTLELLDAEPMVPGEYECVCAPDVTGMIVHEAFGHGVEMDMFVKDRALARQFIGEYVASPLVTMHDGAAAVDETGTFFFDDEGTTAHDTVIIEKGILRRGISDLQSAMYLGTEPTGNGRRESWERKAYTRMTNTYFEPGTDKVEDMIASIKYGFLLENAESGMEDPKNWGIQCMVNIAREIKDGKLTGKMFSPVVLTGYVPDLLKSISMVSSDFELGGGGMCGKGYKEWVKVSDGGPYIKAKIRLG